MTQKWEVKHLILLIALSFCWGPSFFFIKLALKSFPPLTLVTIRLLLGALLIYPIILYRGRRLLPHRRYIGHFFMMGFLSCAFPFLLITKAETVISSSLAAIINGSTPIFTGVMAHLFFRDERLNAGRIGGIILGVIGLLIVFLPSAFDKMAGNELGILMVVIASVSYGAAMIYGKRFLKEVPGLIAPAWQLICAGILVLPFALFFDHPFSLPPPETTALIGLLSLTAVGTALAFYLYFLILRKAGATYLSLGSLLFPLIGIILGVIFQHETLKWTTYVGFVLILLGLVTTSLRKEV